MPCCGNCFGDAYLALQIANLSDAIGRCEYCDSENVALIDPMQLADYFELLISVYTDSTDPSACTILDLLRQDWGLFENLKTAKASLLLQAILPDIDITDLKYLPLVAQDRDALSQWESFREELKHENRFFPNKVMEKELLERLIGLLEVEGNKLDTIVYRARIIEQRMPYLLTEMGQPPKETASHGRANPFGIPCLYAASDNHTAILEVRPHKGERVCVASFTVDPSMTFVDLRDPRKTISPFDLSEDDIQWVLKYMGYLCRLGEELSKPVIPKDAHLEYLPSQYLCEFIKHCGFDGVIYRSALGSGINLAIFNDSKLAGIEVKTYQIDSINVAFSVSS